jgi:hypothetical protein
MHKKNHHDGKCGGTKERLRQGYGVRKPPSPRLRWLKRGVAQPG